MTADTDPIAFRQRVRDAFDGPGLDLEPGVIEPSWLQQRGTPPPEGKIRPAAVLIPLVHRDDEITVLLTQRTEHLKSHAGQIAFPGGREEAFDGTPEVTALRETHEEIGVPPEHIELVGRLNVRETGTGFRVTPVVGFLDPPFPLRPDPNEVAEVFEVPMSFVLDPANHKREVRKHHGLEREFYVLPWQDYYIWGLTARLLVNLADHLKSK